jgi:hypothetical protein
MAIAAALFLLGASAASAANPFLGRWAIQSFGQSGDLVFQFTSDTEMLIASGEETTPAQGYVIDQSSQRLTLPMSDGNTIVLRYVWEGTDSFVLFMTGKVLEDMVAAFTASLPQDANPLTNQIIEDLRGSVRDVFVRNPFMRGTRID